MENLHLGYHYVREGKAPGPNCSPNRLRVQIEALLRDGYEIFTCGEVARRLRQDKSLPEKHATLSFDDGLKDQYTTAFPILREFGVPATFFYITCALENELPPVIGFQILIDQLGAERLEQEILPTVFKGTPYVDLLDPARYDVSGRKVGELPEVQRIKWMFNHWPSQAFKRDRLAEMFSRYIGDDSQGRFAAEWFINKNELLEMQQAGMEIASHSDTHPPLDISGFVEIEQEAQISKQKLFDLLGRSVETFGWTFGGQFREDTKRVVGRSYTTAWNFFSIIEAMPDQPYADFLDIPRLHEQLFLPE